MAYVEYPEAQTVLHLIYKTLVTLLIYKPLYLLILAQNKGKNGWNSKAKSSFYYKPEITQTRKQITYDKLITF